MIPFQFKMWFESVTRPPRADRFTERSFKRVVVRFVMLTLFPLYELSNAFFFALDYVFFPGFHKTPVNKPVQVIGNPRSGTTFLHRLLAMDDANFITARAWQIMLPSLTQQAIIKGIGKVDRAIGSPLWKLVVAIQNRMMKGVDTFHKFRLDVPEEDEGYFVHPFASGFLAMLFPRDEWDYYQKLDEMADEDRKPLMRFYKRCIQRVLYWDKKGRGLLSKNPLFNAKINSLYETFPDVRIVYLVRHPSDMLCSVQNMLLTFWLAQGLEIPEGMSLQRPGLMEWAIYNYGHAMKALDNAPKGSYCIVKYDDLVADPKGTVEHIYQELDIPLGDPYRQVLADEMAKARKYKSKHKYSLEKFDLSHAQVEAALPFVYERYGFPLLSAGEPEGGDGPPAAAKAEAAKEAPASR